MPARRKYIQTIHVPAAAGKNIRNAAGEGKYPADERKREIFRRAFDSVSLFLKEREGIVSPDYILCIPDLFGIGERLRIFHYAGKYGYLSSGWSHRLWLWDGQLLLIMSSKEISW